MKVCAFLHAPFEKPGVFKDWALSKGFQFDEVHAYDGEPIPSVDDYDFFLFMGGPHSPSQVEKYPYLGTEIHLAQAAMAKNKYVVGVCLGAQIMGEALGAAVEKSPHKEVGVFPITLTPDGESDPLFNGLPSVYPVAHWHCDMPGLSAGAVVLATSEGCPRQIVRYGESALALQCHLEMTRDMVEGMIQNCPEDIHPGTYIQSAEELLAQDYLPANRLLCQLMDRLLLDDTATRNAR